MAWYIIKNRGRFYLLIQVTTEVFKHAVIVSSIVSLNIVYTKNQFVSMDRPARLTDVSVGTLSIPQIRLCRFLIYAFILSPCRDHFIIRGSLQTYIQCRFCPKNHFCFAYIVYFLCNTNDGRNVPISAHKFG
jgi:hypothetical protein